MEEILIDDKSHIPYNKKSLMETGLGCTGKKLCGMQSKCISASMHLSLSV
jgi:hypothetical protein